MSSLENTKIEYLGDLQRLEIKPGDRFVLTTDQIISLETCEKIQQIWAKFTEGKGKELLILMPGMKLGVIGGLPEKE